MSDVLPFPAPAAARLLTDVEVAALGRWARHSTLPAWRECQIGVAVPVTDTPPERIARLIAEHTAMRTVLDLVGEFAVDLSALIRRMGVGDANG